MKKILIVLGTVFMLLGLSGVAGAFTIDYSKTVVGDEFYSPYYTASGFVTEDFNSPPTIWTWSGNGQIKSSSNSHGAAPAGYLGVADATPYVAVPNADNSVNLYQAELGGTYNYFGLWWGSADWAAYGYIYNELRFYSGANLVETVTPNDLLGVDANGSWYSASDNTYVNIYGLPSFDKIQMYSSTYAFEADNMTVGVVPEPATMLLLGLGMVGLAGIKRRMR